MKSLSYYLMSYLTQYLPDEKGCSANTIATYRYCFLLLLRFLKQDGNQTACGDFDRLDMRTVISFLDWLKANCKCCIQTRNNRLAAIRSFAQYVSAQDPEYLYLYQQMKAIPTKKSPTTLIDYLTMEEVRTLLSSIDTGTANGLRNAAMLSLLYDSAARVQELCDLAISNVDVMKCTVTLTGKGRKTRCVPIMKRTVQLVSSYLKHMNSTAAEAAAPLFPNRTGNKMTRAGVAYIFGKYVEIARLPRFNNLHPHCLRHSKAIHMLDSGIQLYYIRDFLGHSSIQTTEIYLRVSQTQIRAALENLNGNTAIPRSKKMPWQKPGDLYGWLCALGK